MGNAAYQWCRQDDSVTVAFLGCHCTSYQYWYREEKIISTGGSTPLLFLMDKDQMKKITLSELFEADVLPQEEDEEAPGISIILPDEPVTEDAESLALFSALSELNILEAAFDAAEVFLSHTGDEESRKVAEARFYASVPETIVLKAGGASGFKEKAAVKIKQAIAKVKAAITNVLTKFVGDSRVKQLRLESARKGVANGTYFTGVVPLNKSHHAFATDLSGGRSATVDFMNSKQIAATLEAALDSINNLPRALSSLGKLDNANYTKDLGKILTDLYGFGATVDSRAMSFGFTKDQSMALSVIMSGGISPKMVNAKAAIVKAGRVDIDKGDFEKGSEAVIKGFAAMPKVQRAIAQYNTQLNEENAKTQSAIARILGITVAMYKETLNGGYRVLGGSIKKTNKDQGTNMSFLYPEQIEIAQLELELEAMQKAEQEAITFEASAKTEADEARFMYHVPEELVMAAGGKQSFIKRAGAAIANKIQQILKAIKDMFSRIFGKAATKKAVDEADKVGKKAEATAKKVEEEINKDPRKMAMDLNIPIAIEASVLANGKEIIHPLEVVKKTTALVETAQSLMAGIIQFGLGTPPKAVDEISDTVKRGFEAVGMKGDMMEIRPWAGTNSGFRAKVDESNPYKLSFHWFEDVPKVKNKVVRNVSLEDLEKYSASAQQSIVKSGDLARNIDELMKADFSKLNKENRDLAMSQLALGRDIALLVRRMNQSSIKACSALVKEAEKKLKEQK
ncbi:hypothetical protein [Vibrio phage vB_pir03]|nr:hypothetical protein [Vibrio phage vB_pir03]